MNSYNSELKALFNESRSKTTKIKKIADDWEIDDLSNSLMGILKIIEEKLQNQLTQIEDSARPIHLPLEINTLTVSTKTDHKDITEEPFDRPTKKPGHPILTRSKSKVGADKSVISSNTMNNDKNCNIPKGISDNYDDDGWSWCEEDEDKLWGGEIEDYYRAKHDTLKGKRKRNKSLRNRPY